MGKARIAIIDGQGGGIGRALCEKLSRQLPDNAELLAFGTNALATSVMLKAGASSGASGDNAIIHNAPRVDIISGPIGILLANALMGELSAPVAAAIGASPAVKVLVPLPKCGVRVAGSETLVLADAIDSAVRIILAEIRGILE